MLKEWVRRKMTLVVLTFGLLALCLVQIILLITEDIANSQWLAFSIGGILFFAISATAWHIERTPEGFKRISPGKPVQRTGKKLRRMLLAGALLYLALRVLERIS